MSEQAPRYTDREAARDYFTREIERQQRNMQGQHSFSAYPRSLIIDHCAWGLRWIDCAPDGANFTRAPMQDKRGVPMGGVYDENLGPCRALRDARAALGLNPFSGMATDRKEA